MSALEDVQCEILDKIAPESATVGVNCNYLDANDAACIALVDRLGHRISHAGLESKLSTLCLFRPLQGTGPMGEEVCILNLGGFKFRDVYLPRDAHDQVHARAIARVLRSLPQTVTQIVDTIEIHCKPASLDLDILNDVFPHVRHIHPGAARREAGETFSLWCDEKLKRTGQVPFPQLKTVTSIRALKGNQNLDSTIDLCDIVLLVQTRKALNDKGRAPRIEAVYVSKELGVDMSEVWELLQRLVPDVQV